MTGDKVKKAVAEMAAIVGRDRPGIAAERHPEARTHHDQLEHLLYMAGEIPKMVDQGKLEKAMRWLGFMQGVLWSRCDVSLEELKKMNMPGEEKHDAEVPPKAT